ncbi:MAG TPA: biopolymer transporter ExbD [Candidatus Nanopelagicales bacterium]|nr:biopolymer transporter ExbD [Candidatus Nanopelagicales bacterium]
MGGIDVGGSSGKRPMNSDINMIPFIDLLMVTISFLLITAVWVTNSRIEANAQVPSQEGCGEECSKQPQRTLHVHVQENEFGLVWKDGATVLSENKIPKQAMEVGKEGAKSVRYPGLADAIRGEWKRNGMHVDAADRKVDQAVLHSDNGTPFRELVAVLDAISGSRREMVLGDGKRAEVGAFQTTFASR